jgi:hypothetical protein
LWRKWWWFAGETFYVSLLISIAWSCDIEAKKQASIVSDNNLTHLFLFFCLLWAFPKLLPLWGVEEETHADDDDDDDMHCKLMSSYSSVEPPFLAVEDWWILFFL